MIREAKQREKVSKIFELNLLYQKVNGKVIQILKCFFFTCFYFLLSLTILIQTQAFSFFLLLFNRSIIHYKFKLFNHLSDNARCIAFYASILHFEIQINHTITTEQFLYFIHKHI